MRKEKDCMPYEKFLFSNVILSNNTIDYFKNLCIERCLAKLKLTEFSKFINWNKKNNEIALYTGFAYADLKIPKTFNCIFDLNNPKNFIVENITLTQSIYEGFLPTDSMDNGHRHIAIFEFKSNIPDFLSKLFVSENDLIDAPKNSMTIGICQTQDFKEIKKGLNFIEN